MPSRVRSWIKDASGNVFESTSDPSKPEYYRDTLFHYVFGEMFGKRTVRLVDSCSFPSPDKVPLLYVGSSSVSVVTLDPSTGEEL